MSALGSLVVKLALEYAEYTQGLDKSSQEALKFAKNAQTSFDKAGNSAKEFLGNVAGNVAGAIVSVVGLNSAFSRITESINILNSLDDAAQKTGSSIEDLSRIEQVARNFGDAFNPIEQGITRLAKGLAEIDDPTSNAIRALDAIGVSARDSNGELRTAADVYIDVARSLQQYEDGTRKTAVAQALFGKSGAELLPMLNNLAQGVDHVTAVTQANAAQAALFNDQLALGKARVTGFFTSLSVDLLPTLNNIALAVNNSTGQISSFSVVSTAASAVLKGLAIAGASVVGIIDELGRGIGARAAQFAALTNLDFSGAKFIGQAYAEDNIKARAEFRKFVDTVLNGEQQIAQAIDVGGTNKAIDFQVKLPVAVDAATKSIDKQTKAFDLEVVKLKQYESEAKRARDITDSVATKQERYNQTLEELERLKPYFTVEAYTRALDKAKRELQDVGAVNRQVTTEMDQLWIQAGRNIQSTFANSIFDFFNDGLDGMWRNAKSAVGRILSEFAALKFSQSIGLSAMFAVPGAASASGVGGTGASAFDIASLSANAATLFKTGFGATGLLGSAISGAGSFLNSGSIAAFGGGFAGDAIGGLAAGGFTSGAASAASLGASVAAFAGPAIVVAAVDQITRLLAGDKMLGGAAGKILNYVPVIGPLINGLFGRGPLKQKSTSLTGTIGAEGFESGFLQTDFVAKGGLFRSDKNDFARIDAVTGAIETDNRKLNEFAAGLARVSKDILGLISETTTQTSEGLRKIGADLGLSVDGINNFSHTIELVSEKGKMLSDEQISEEIARITDGLARGLLPEVDNFAKRGETAIQTVNRLGAEFSALTESAKNLGASSQFARELIKNMSIEARTAFIDLAGGPERLANLTSSFSKNFLTDAERLAIVRDDLKTQLTGLGLAADLTNDQYKALIQTVSLSDETRIKLLGLGDALFAVNSAADAAANTIKQNAAVALNSAFVDLQKSVDAERKRATDQYNVALEQVNSRIQQVSDSIGKLKNLSGALANTVDALRPISRDEAKFQILSAINTAKAGGGLPEVGDINKALSALQSNNITGARSSFELAREQAKTANLVQELGDLTDSQLTIEERSLKQLEGHQRTLQEGFQNEMDRLDSLIERAQLEINSINGLNTSIVDLTKAIANFNLASSQGGGGVIGGGEISGNPNISNQAIIDYFKVPRTPEEIARDAAANGVTSQQIINTGRFTQAEADKFFRDNSHIPRFADGGFHRGGLRIVGERGPELERTGPSHITSNNNLKKTIGNDEVVASVKKLIKKLDQVIQGGDFIRVKTVA
ncbi:hypothetical protein SAMN06296273_1160 [Nitrosomonas ureae]|uniref:Uncharacterized protein n=1 Tax=Nitrosomonas ureae TaxID=44577 RepID=A0A285BWP9_9PROT|nr:hypothetical protein [Nitrosomonas ureae]SNX59724.1 hypothetical protein SAMN06296273_1160 [Nitrosomonas ureae]